MALAAGVRLGIYEITAPLGAGGMGEVYRAHDARLRRDVAIKILPAALADDPNRRTRLEREAQALAALSHPNIAAIYGLEESGGACALVMELVEGQTLAERIAVGAIPIEEALAIARQIASAMEAAHEKGIVHRDLKPANIKLTPDGQVKVLDFGLAKALDSGASSSSAGALNDSPTLTLDAASGGVILGTAAYMSPEQARGKPVDKRADIWAFGIIFLEMLTGRAVFLGETLSDTLAGVLRGEIDWKALPPETPPAVRRLIARCLERDPKRRLRDIGDAWIEVDAPIAPVLPPAAPAGPLPWIVAGFAVLVAAAGIAWGILHKPAPQPRPVTRWSASFEGSVHRPQLSRDGSVLLFATFGGAPLSVRRMDQLEAKPLPGTEGAIQTALSPDGQWIAFSSNRDGRQQLQKIRISGGSPTVLCVPDAPALGISWGDDGNIVFGGRNGLKRVSSAGGTPEALTTPDTKEGPASHNAPEILPGSRAVLFVMATPSSPQVAILDMKSRAIRVLAHNASRPGYASTGHLLYYRSGALFAAPFNAARMEVTGAEMPVVEGVGYASLPTQGDYGLSADGLLVYIEGAGSRPLTIAWADRKGAIEQISEPSAWHVGRLSPDGSRMASSLGLGDNEDIWIYDLARRTPTRLTFEGKNTNPAWSPDGRWIFYHGGRGARQAIYRMAADGSGRPELMVETERRAFPSSSDGRTLIYSETGSDGKGALWSVVLPGGKPARIHDSAQSESEGELSPDGRWLAYLATDSGRRDIYVCAFPGAGARTRISTQNSGMPRWSRDGKELFFRSGSDAGDAQAMAVKIQPGPVFRASSPQPLFKLNLATTFDVAPDGRRFLVAIAPGSGSRMIGVENWFEELKRLAPAAK